jgi:hypothetical protein
VGVDRLGMSARETSAATDSCSGGRERWGVEAVGSFGGMTLAMHFPAVRWEHEGVFDQQSRVVFRCFLAGVGGGCAEREAHGEDAVVVVNRIW